jgi:probable F420-dependent oxidoreductase
MHFGVHLRPTDYGIDPRELAVAVEAHGFESFYVSEHSHIPVRTVSQWPGGAGMPRFMSHFLDPFVTLGAVAAVTTKLRLGTGIVLAPQRDMIQLAKEVATLDYLSHGRLLLGIGAGWNEEEMRNHGVEPLTRFARMREQALALRRIWSEDEPEFHGRQVDFDPIWIWPKPVQQPFPVYLGGEGPTVLQRAVEYADGWLPNDHSELPERVTELRRLSNAAGRAPLPVTAFAVRPELERIRTLAAAEVGRCVFNLPDAGADEVLPALERLANIRVQWETLARS